jgi:hypothetical protein
MKCVSSKHLKVVFIFFITFFKYIFLYIELTLCVLNRAKSIDNSPLFNFSEPNHRKQPLSYPIYRLKNKPSSDDERCQPMSLYTVIDFSDQLR